MCHLVVNLDTNGISDEKEYGEYMTLCLILPYNYISIYFLSWDVTLPLLLDIVPPAKLTSI